MYQPGHVNDPWPGVLLWRSRGRKNVLAIMIQSFVSMGWTTVIWYLYGYSLCFSGDWHGSSAISTSCLHGVT